MKAGYSVKSCVTINFSKNTLHQGVSQLYIKAWIYTYNMACMYSSCSLFTYRMNCILTGTMV